MTNLTSFKHWVKKNLYGKKIICHFYIKDSSHQYYDNADFVYFNLLSKSRGWIIKGTTEHGISSTRKKRSQIPCLNCFEADEKLYDGLRTLLKNGNKKFEFAILLIRRKLDSKYKVINVSIKRPKKTPPLNLCHHFDAWSGRKALTPFNFCDVVRVEITKKHIDNIPIAEIPKHWIPAVLCRHGDKNEVAQYMKAKGMKKTKIFPIL